MQLFIFSRPVQSNNYIRFGVSAHTQEEAGNKFQNYLDSHGEMIGSKEPWRNYWMMDIAGKVGDGVFTLHTNLSTKA